ncbi:MAG TPA: hypothetical protein VN948_02130 [Terriglobales bacterium]|nr:hypothetical protein [Terriglobales bacterium]
MPNKRELTAKVFRDAFVASYERVRNSFTKERWNEMWHRWNDLMLLRPDEGSLLPREIKASVLAGVAGELGLCYPSEYRNRQPMTLDAAFSDHADNQDRFPIKVAIEHENDWTGFESEIKKLLSVRCPLKVGITYSDDSPKGREYRQTIAGNIQEDFEEIRLVIGEAPAAEYLFLVGAESDDNEISCWYSLDFRAENGPRDQSFRPVGKAKRTAA